MTVQAKLSHVRSMELTASSVRTPFVLSRLSNVPALSSTGVTLFPNLVALYIAHFAQPLTLHGWEQRSKQSFLAGVTNLEISVTGRRVIGPPPVEDSPNHQTREEAQQAMLAAQWLLSLHPYGLINLRDVHIHLDYEWLCLFSVEQLLGKQPALHYIILDLSHAVRLERHRNRSNDKYWGKQPRGKDTPTWEEQQRKKRERKDQILDAFMVAVEKLHDTYRTLDVNGVSVRLDGDSGNELKHMFIDRIRRWRSMEGVDRYIVRTE